MPLSHFAELTNQVHMVLSEGIDKEELYLESVRLREVKPKNLGHCVLVAYKQTVRLIQLGYNGRNFLASPPKPRTDSLAREKREEELVEFSKHLYAIKNWFTRISAPNKKRYLLALLEDTTSAWAIAVILLCIWNSQTKDAVMSTYQAVPWSSYDQSPMDHNRTARPMQTLAQVMKMDRKWYLSLEPDSQSLVMCELLAVTGGPMMHQVLQRAQVIYERYRSQQLKKIEMSGLVLAPSKILPSDQQKPDVKIANSKPDTIDMKPDSLSIGQKCLLDHLAVWEKTITSMKDSLHLKEEEVTFTDGTKQKIWKVMRIKPEDKETVDYIQMLPSELGKMILSYLPRESLAQCVNVNKYWAYLVEELRTEQATRVKLDADIAKLLDLMLRHELSIENFNTADIRNKTTSFQATSFGNISTKMRSQVPFTIKSSVKSVGAYSFRHFLNYNMNKPEYAALQIPIRNLGELSERVARRGTVDDNLWGWCATTLQRRRSKREHALEKSDMRESEKDGTEGGVLVLGNVHFPSPLMTHTLKLPLYPPLVVDHTARPSPRKNRNISNATGMSVGKGIGKDRFCLWTRNVSRLYVASKIPSYTKIGK